MAVVEFEEGTLSIDAAVIGRGLSVEPWLVQARMREGKITVLCERGVDEDAGRYRLTFFYQHRRFRLVVDVAVSAGHRRDRIGRSYFNSFTQTSRWQRIPTGVQKWPAHSLRFFPGEWARCSPFAACSTARPQ